MEARTGKYPMIVVETFPNLVKHLKNLEQNFSKSPYIQCRRNQIQFIPCDGPEYHAIVKYLNDIQATEPDLRYVIRPLDVCIRGIPSILCIEDVKAACTERGYVVEHIKQITTNLCYVKLSGGTDNTRILEMRELLTFRVRVELWKSGPVRRELEHSEPNDTVTNSTSYIATRTDPPPRLEYSAAQSTSNQIANREEAIAAQYPSIVVESFPNLVQHLNNIKEQLGTRANCHHRKNRIRFLPADGVEYHGVVQYLKSIKTTEPDLKYTINPLSVTICGLPSCIPVEDVKTAITVRGYSVAQVKQITADLYYAQICGGNDNTKILEMEELFGYHVWIDLWSSGSVERKIESREPMESITKSINTETSIAPPTVAPEDTADQSTGNQNISEDRIAKYPAIVVETFPNWPKHLENIAEDFGRLANAEAWYRGIRFVPRDGAEYHAVISYLKSIEATEPGLKYVVRALDVCIYGLPNNISTEDVKTACTERGYLVNHVKRIPTTSVGSLHYVKICGKKDNTKILAMRELLGYTVKVELWRGGPVKKEKQPVTRPTNDIETSALPAPAVSLLTPEYQAGPAQYVRDQFANGVASSLFPPLVPDRLAARSAQHQAATAPPVPPHTEQAVLAGQSTDQQASPPSVPPRRSSLPVLAGQSAGQAPAAPPRLPGISPEQLAALTTQITALTLTFVQIYGQHRSQ